MVFNLSFFPYPDGFLRTNRGLIPNLRSRTRRPSNDATLDELSDEELIAHLEGFDFEANYLRSAEFGQQSPIWRFSPDTVMKGVIAKATFEPYTMFIASTQTSIPVPKVRRYLYWSSRLWIFMEYVQGEDLRDVWGSLNMMNKLWLAWTLRGYVAQLRAVHLANRDNPGPLDDAGTSLPCNGHYFTEIGAGPFASYREMSSWFDSKYRISLQLEQQSAPDIVPEHSEEHMSFDSSMPLALTHGDISLSNIRLGQDGTLWLLDWEWSGAYPEWFEYSCILAYENDQNIPRAWLRLAPFIAGQHESKLAFLRHIMPALISFGFEEQ